MGNGSLSFLEISIDFHQSHLFFPIIVTWILLLLLVAIFFLYGLPFLLAVRRGEKTLDLSVKHFDSLRFFGTIILTIVYFLLMDYVGGFFPNMGLGFLLMSVPFMFLLSLLYVHDIDRRKILLISLNALIAPGVAWYVLANMFNISLP